MKTAKLTLRRDGVIWNILINNNERKVVAEIYLDHLAQISEVILNPGYDLDHNVLMLVASHAKQYFRSRRGTNGVFRPEFSNPRLTEADSNRLMDFSLVPDDIKGMTQADIEKGLESLEIKITRAVHTTEKKALMTILIGVGVPGISYEISSERPIFRNQLKVTFTVPTGYQFTFWKDVRKPEKRSIWDLHIVPGYHPCMKDWKSIGLINGTTDKYIGGYAVEYIYSPEEARSRTPRGFGTWDELNHPFSARGASVTLAISGTQMRSAEGVREVVELLKAALSLDRTYVSVSGGFNAPFTSAHNVLVNLGRKSPWPEAEGNSLTRGSEEHCVWGYRVLEAEGELDRAYVPEWFREENWLGVYQDAGETIPVV